MLSCLCVLCSVYDVIYSVYDVMYNGGAQCFSYQTSSSPLPCVVNVKLADYGISRFANPGGVKGEEGTPGYLAPEAIRRRGEDQAFDEKVCTFNNLTCPTTTSSLSLSLCTHTHAFTHIIRLTSSPLLCSCLSSLQDRDPLRTSQPSRRSTRSH